VKFQPFIEGEQIILVTDHSALQWAKTYENANRRLAAWGAIYSAYTPGLEIVHRPGKIHDNVDPLSRLRRGPDSVLPSNDPSVPIIPDANNTVLQEKPYRNEPAKKAVSFVAYSIQACLEAPPGTVGKKEVKAVRTQVGRVVKPSRKARENMESPTPDSLMEKGRMQEDDVVDALSFSPANPDVPSTLEAEGGNMDEDSKSDDEQNDILDTPYERAHKREPPPPHIQVAMNGKTLRLWSEAYPSDTNFAQHWKTAKDEHEALWYAGHRYYKDSRGLLFFRDADFIPRLCVPRRMVPSVLIEAHESAHVLAHSGPLKLYQILGDRFYWQRMKKDIERFCASCDVCQKIKPLNFGKFGYLQPNDIPTRPYESISLDLIGPLPESLGYTAILVIVCRLSKHAQFVATTFSLGTSGFAHLFVKNVACRYGLPDSIYADRDGRWFLGFWREVSLQMKIRMALSSARHPQHNGQTEIVNRQLEWMLRAYVAEDRSTWATWLHLLELAYNLTLHASTSHAPYKLLYGFVPKNFLDFVHSTSKRRGPPRTSKDEVLLFLDNIKAHRDAACSAIAQAQVKQAENYN
jgi:hypothetical protein